MQQKKGTFNVSVVEVHASGPARTALGLVIAAKKASSQFAQTNPKVMDACDGVIAAGQKVSAASSNRDAAHAAAAQADAEYEEAIIAYDQDHAVLVAESERAGTSEADFLSIGLLLAYRQKHVLAEPLSVDSRYDVLVKVVRLTVKLPPGITGCITEMSTDPTDPTKWQRLKGMAARRVLEGLAAGTYWFRAASMKGDDDSDYTSPVAVIVT
jgi:hypothetical protein